MDVLLLTTNSFGFWLYTFRPPSWRSPHIQRSLLEYLASISFISPAGVLEGTGYHGDDECDPIK